MAGGECWTGRRTWCTWRTAWCGDTRGTGSRACWCGTPSSSAAGTSHSPAAGYPTSSGWLAGRLTAVHCALCSILPTDLFTLLLEPDCRESLPCPVWVRCNRIIRLGRLQEFLVKVNRKSQFNQLVFILKSVGYIVFPECYVDRDPDKFPKHVSDHQVGAGTHYNCKPVFGMNYLIGFY